MKLQSPRRDSVSCLMLSRQASRTLSRILPFGAIWLIFSTIYSLMERGMLGTLDYYPATGNPYDFKGTVFITAFTALTCGLLIGTVEVLWLNKIFIRRSFWQKVVFKTFVYLTFIITFLLLTALFFNAQALEASVFDGEVLQNTSLFFRNFAFWSIVLYIGSIISISLFFHEVNGNLGHGVVTNFFSGKYHAPKEEERIFMFLDMKSSTTIAEQIGHEKYFAMLREYFADLSAPIIEHAGEVYQYAGDEVIITWTLKSGLENNACIQCFFALKDELARHEAKYQAAFGIMPAFKAGLHAGKVTTGEIGVIRKEIIFTGDVLNTAARIQGLCNSYTVDILVSGDLISRLSPGASYQVSSLGEHELRGRGRKIEVFTVSR